MSGQTDCDHTSHISKYRPNVAQPYEHNIRQQKKTTILLPLN